MRSAPLSDTIFITHVRILRNGCYANVSHYLFHYLKNCSFLISLEPNYMYSDSKSMCIQNSLLFYFSKIYLIGSIGLDKQKFLA